MPSSLGSVSILNLQLLVLSRVSIIFSLVLRSRNIPYELLIES